MKVVPESRVHSGELREELTHALSFHFGAKQPIRNLHRRRSNYSSSNTIENLQVELENGRRLGLIFKDLSPTSLLEAARQVRPQFVYSPQREIQIYRTLLDPARFETPVCYGFVERPDIERYWLFLERVEGPLLWQVGRVAVWEHSARWLALFHSHFAHHRPASGTDLTRFGRELCTRWMNRAEEFLQPQWGARSNGLLKQFDLLARKYERVIGPLLSMPQTFIHAEFYPSNIILGGTGPDKRVCAIDWERGALGPGLVDLAALVSGSWTDEQKKHFVAVYRNSLEPAGDWPPPINEMLELVDYCQLYLAVQWLGWAEDWSPPKSHDQNWLQEAVRISKRLGLLG
jgi:aminoglycoside phosphotransferase (APT) family kinase protein